MDAVHTTRFGDLFEELFTKPKHPIIDPLRILVVVDGGISLTETAGGFGLGRVIRLLRETRVGCLDIEVDTARREFSQAGNPTYSAFRFDDQVDGLAVLDRYDEVWCLGFNPGNDDGDDDRIEDAIENPLTDSELAALTKWMNERKGGVLAMGDHDYLGASMCYRIPRVGTMRRWTNDDGVPPSGLSFHPDREQRHDTNQAASAAQRQGAFVPTGVERDATPQPIEWVQWRFFFERSFLWRSTPHPILCHPEHGPIDVLPDHPHEGWCFENDEVETDRTYAFDNETGDEYPSNGLVKPTPRVIAYGRTTHTLNHEKGPVLEKRFPLINVYDGAPVGVGRVVTDSTWHHWFDMNVQGIEAEAGEDWDKVRRYFQNVAIWLAGNKIADRCFLAEIFGHHFSYAGLEEYHPDLDVFDLGLIWREQLTSTLGPCYVYEWLLLRIGKLWPIFVDPKFGPGVGQSLTPKAFGLPVDVLLDAALGGAVHALGPVAAEARSAVLAGESYEIDEADLLARVDDGLVRGLDHARAHLRESLAEVAEVVDLLDADRTPAS